MPSLRQCASGICNHSSSISFRDFVYIAKLILFESLHFISLSFYTNTSAPHGFGSSFLPIPQAPLIQSETIQAFFPRISKGMFLFSAASLPRIMNILNVPLVVFKVTSVNRILLPVLTVGSFHSGSIALGKYSLLFSGPQALHLPSFFSLSYRMA
ncbi:MAG: hypothetical protein PHO27_10610 [Sulfuricurvum sp.]|nr:hypothetical protein [Sulfuricurvum sp.]